jgi:hypothetical protein
MGRLVRRLPTLAAAAGLLAAAAGLLAVAAGGQAPVSRDQFPMRTFFSVRSAQPDDTVPEVLREQFEKDDGSPLRSVAIDLNGDGTPEKLVLCGVPAQSGGFQWLVYDVKNGTGRGLIIGTLIFVGSETDNGYARLETYWRQGGDMSVVSRYAFDKTRYGRTGTKALSLWETSEYFRAKGRLDPETELVEIK